jgi:isopenicillin-N epimerase
MANEYSAHWELDPALAYLDHGAFGACPRAVLEAQQQLRARIERDPAQFFMRDLESLLEAARAALGAFVHADPDDLAYVPNATSAVNAVLRSLRFAPGDELLVTDHAYGACSNALAFVAQATGARVVVAKVPFPIASDDEVLAAIVSACSDKTRLALVDHVTSSTAIVFPVARICTELGQRGIDVVIDGAHAPGMLELNIPALGATYYAGNCHKWLCAAKGAGFLWVRRDRQAQIHPTTISHGWAPSFDDKPRFRQEFDWTGTQDPTPYLCVPYALELLGKLLPGGWPALRQHNHDLALTARELICRALDVAPPVPDHMLGSMTSVPIREPRDEEYGDDFRTDPAHQLLKTRFAIEVPVLCWPKWPSRMIRVSTQIYNTRDDIERLAKALPEVLAM